MTLRVRATILQTPAPGRLEVLEDQLIRVDDEGVIESIADADRVGSGDTPEVVLPEGVVLVPGLVDAHVHAPQWPQLGTGLDLPLDEWLQQYTFPLEARYSDAEFANAVWHDLVEGLLAEGTTTAVYYSSRHELATELLAATCVERGQRALVGRVAMDHPDGCPDYYRDESASASVDASARSIEAIRALDDPHGLVAPMVTPRFIPSCTDAALAGLGELAAATGVAVQTHCSESDWQHRYSHDRFGVSDAEALDRFGLLTDKGIVAHATHLDEGDRSLLAKRGTGIAHCPLSNAYFSNAVFEARRAMRAGVRVGLGTDIAGGSEPSLFRQCEHAVTSSRILEDGVRPTSSRDPGARLDVVTAFWMATRGGAEAVGLDVGLLEAGRPFDAVAVHGTAGAAGWRDDDSWPRRFEKMVRRTSRRDIAAVWVQGRQVVG